VLLQEVPEAQNRALVRNRVFPQLHSGEAPHGLAVVECILRRRIRQIEPLLEKVDPQHLLKPERLAAPARLRVMRLDQPHEPRPRDHRVHLGQEAFAPRHLALARPRESRKRPLISHGAGPLRNGFRRSVPTYTSLAADAIPSGAPRTLVQRFLSGPTNLLANKQYTFSANLQNAVSPYTILWYVKWPWN